MQLGLEYRIHVRHAVGDQEGTLRRPRHPIRIITA